MPTTEIDELIAAYAQAAVDVLRAGFDAIELHGVHGCLIDNFSCQGRNQREDKYGGSLQSRTPFAVEIMQAIRSEMGLI